MRVFIALDLPQSARQMLLTLQERLVEMNAGGRTVPANNMHLTLRFFENLTDREVDLAAQAVETVSAKAHTPLMTIAGVGGFVRSGGDTVYARIGGDLDAVIGLQQQLSAELMEYGIKPDNRPFYPHITLMHGANYRTASQLNVRSDFFFATTLTLYRSILSQNASPVYDPLLSIPLAR